MDFHMRLPRGKREFTLFIAIVSILSVNTIAPLITCFEFGFHIAVWADVLKVIPFIWLCVVALVLLTYKPSEWLTHKIVAEGDSFRAVITINILCTVLFMSIFLTVIGTWIGSRTFNAEPLKWFFHKWPRNYAISFAVEALFAQPIARAVLYKLHKSKDKQV
jgi:hypothetical protein